MDTSQIVIVVIIGLVIAFAATKIASAFLRQNKVERALIKAQSIEHSAKTLLSLKSNLGNTQQFNAAVCELDKLLNGNKVQKIHQMVKALETYE